MEETGLLSGSFHVYGDGEGHPNSDIFRPSQVRFKWSVLVPVVVQVCCLILVRGGHVQAMIDVRWWSYPA